LSAFLLNLCRKYLLRISFRAFCPLDLLGDKGVDFISVSVPSLVSDSDSVSLSSSEKSLKPASGSEMARLLKVIKYKLDWLFVILASLAF